MPTIKDRVKGTILDMAVLMMWVVITSGIFILTCDAVCRVFDVSDQVLRDVIGAH